MQPKYVQQNRVKGTEWHHIVPRQIYSGKLTNLSAEQQEEFLRARAFLIDHGFDQKYTDSVGLRMPSRKDESIKYNTRRSEHGWTSEHKKYNVDLVTELNEIRKNAKRDGSSHEETRQLIYNKLEAVRHELRRGERQLADRNVRESSRSQFKETLQLTGLTESYNATHPDAPVEARGAQGTKIGGVGNTVGIIKGMKDSHAHLESQHVFVLKTTDGKQPFSDAELQQIIREVAVGIYVHDTIPFFSLHFNSDGTIYPVIHPAYQNTLVGRVIGMLDYIMKGFLNGGIFDEAYIQRWITSNPTADTANDMGQVINLEQYLKQHLGNDTIYGSAPRIIACPRDQRNHIQHRRPVAVRRQGKV